MNYKLKKWLVAKSGIILGMNVFGSVWLELRWNGKKVHDICLVKGSDSMFEAIRLIEVDTF